MDDPSGVRRVERVGDLDAEVKDSFHAQRLAVDLMLQSATRQKLHDNERMAFVLVHFVHSADIRVIEGGRSAGFSYGTFQGRVVILHSWQKDIS